VIGGIEEEIGIVLERIPEVPAKRMEPEVGAYQVGVAAPPEIRA